jgi:hypothetical protein
MIALIEHATPEELQMQREETVELLRRRFALDADVAQRIVRIARNVDHAFALAELMR